MERVREELRARIGALEGRRGPARASVDGGEIDRWLGGGLARGRVHAVAGPGATAFAAMVGARRCCGAWSKAARSHPFILRGSPLSASTRTVS